MPYLQVVKVTVGMGLNPETVEEQGESVPLWDRDNHFTQHIGWVVIGPLRTRDATVVPVISMVTCCK